MTTGQTMAIEDKALRALTLRQQQKEIKRELGPLEDELKTWLANNGRELFDGERRVLASLGTRSGAAEIDLISLAEKRPDLVVDAARMGLLSARVTAVRQQKGRAECADLMLDRYLMPGGEIDTLQIERVS